MSSKKLWGGRFEAELDQAAKDFSYSLEQDAWIVQCDIAVNLAHAKALKKAKILSPAEFKQVSACLENLAKEFEENIHYGLEDDEDIHSAIERLLIEQCGDVGKKIHAGKSRNDQVATDLRLYAMTGTDLIIQQLSTLILVLLETARKHTKTPFPGMTHFQPAQPVLFAHHIMAYCEQFKRDLTRFIMAYEATDVCPLGSGALAGNNYKLDRKLIADELGFSKLSNNSLDAVSDRDYICDILAACNQCMIHFSRFCEEIIIWNSPLLNFITLSDTFTTGSSIMPQKKNPDIAELIRGKCARVQGHYHSMQTLLKGLPLAYNRDMQEDKIPLIDSLQTVSDSIECFTPMIGQMTVNKDVIKKALSHGYITATELADYLVLKGVPFREAHDITGKAVLKAIELKKELHQVPLKDLQALSKHIQKDVFDALTIQAAIDAKDVLGGTATKQVIFQIDSLLKEMQEIMNL